MLVNGSSQQIVRDLFGLPEEVLPTQENVLDDFSCAWQKDVKVFGRLFCTDRSLCFYAHLLGYRTKLVIPFKEVTSVAKDTSAFSKGIAVRCTNERLYVFGSFQHSQETFLFLQRVWHSRCSAEDIDEGTWQEEETLTEENDEGTLLVGSEDPFHVIRKLVLSLTPPEFFQLFLADAAVDSFASVWTELGYNSVRCEAWQVSDSPKTCTRQAYYRVNYADGFFVKDSSRMHEDQRCDLEDNKLVLRSSTRALDTPYHGHYTQEQEWTVTQISRDRCLLRCSTAVKFVRQTKMKRQLTEYVTEELERGMKVWELRFQAHNIIPDENLHPTDVSTYKLVKYEEVDLKKVNSSFMQENKHDIVLLSNYAVLVTAALFLLYLHYRLTLSSHFPPCA